MPPDAVAGHRCERNMSGRGVFGLDGLPTQHARLASASARPAAGSSGLRCACCASTEALPSGPSPPRGRSDARGSREWFGRLAGTHARISHRVRIDGCALHRLRYGRSDPGHAEPEPRLTSVDDCTAEDRCPECNLVGFRRVNRLGTAPSQRRRFVRNDLAIVSAVVIAPGGSHRHIPLAVQVPFPRPASSSMARRSRAPGRSPANPPG